MDNKNIKNDMIKRDPFFQQYKFLFLSFIKKIKNFSNKTSKKIVILVRESID